MDNTVKLPPRLAFLASLVPKGAKVADVGTDHGLLPVWLLENGIAASAVATDIRPGPLSHAENLRRERGLSGMRCILCDGLQEIEPSEADTVIIAGMGGENIAGILRRAPWTRSETLLLLQPMSKPEELRKALEEMQIRIIGEHLVEDTGRIYPVLMAAGGEPDTLTEAEYYTGAYDLVYKEALFLPMLTSLEKKTTAAVQGLEKSKDAFDGERIIHLRRVSAEIEMMRRKYYAEGF